MKTNFTKYSVIILSAGASQRMGNHKALLAFNKTETFADKISNTYLKLGFASIIMVVNNDLYNYYKNTPLKKSDQINLVCNSHPEKGRLHSIQLGLEKTNNTPVFIQNIDNPFVSDNLIYDLISHLQSNIYVNPTYHGKGGHPILLSKEIASQIRKSQAETLKDVLKIYQRISVECNDKMILANINSPEDYYDVFGKGLFTL